MASKVRIPQVRFISKVQLLTGRVLVTLTSGRERSFSYERLSATQESKLRSMAQPLARRREVPIHREAGKPKKSINYAAIVTGRSVGVQHV